MVTFASSSTVKWKLAKKRPDAQEHIKGMSIEEKKSLLADYGIIYDELPEWQRKGVNIEWLKKRAGTP